MEQTVGDRIKIVRETLGLNPRQFALSVDFDPSNYYKIESGKIGVKTNALQGFSTEAVAEILGVSVKVVSVYAKMTRQKVRGEFEKYGGL